MRSINATTVCPRVLLDIPDFDASRRLPRALSDIHDDRASAKLLGTLRSGSLAITPLAVDELLGPLQFNPKRWPVIDITEHPDDE